MLLYVSILFKTEAPLQKKTKIERDYATDRQHCSLPLATFVDERTDLCGKLVFVLRIYDELD